MSEHHSHDHAPMTIERHCDVVVVGGSAAGLAAALQLGRQRRSVIVVDAGEPRNGPAAHLHGYLGSDGTAPSELTERGRAEVRSYGVEVLAGRVVGASQLDGGRFRVELVGGTAVVARRIVIATGLIDELPAIEGLASHWGGTVIHCPFCHGYEARDRRVVQIVTHPMGLHPSPLFRQLTDRLTIVVDPAAEPDIDDDALATLEAGGVEVRRGSASAIVEVDGQLAGVELTDGTRLDADVVAVGPRFRARLEPFVGLGLVGSPHPSGLGDALATDDLGQTGTAGVWAAGNAKDPSQQVLHAAADGSRVGAMVSFSLAEEDLRAVARPSATADDWERRYAGDQIWSGNPNGTLVDLVAGLAPGRAVDVGAGEGGDAIWLAERGWDVLATDISHAALARVGAAAAVRGLTIDARRVDAAGRDPFGAERFDLVSMFYGAIPRSPDRRAERSLIDAVAAGGTLLVVGHDLEPMRAPIDTATHSRAYDPDAFVRVDDVADAVGADPAWEVVIDETRPRPGGAASAAHHVDDRVLMARRRR